MAKGMNKAQQLELAALEAPLLRNASPKTLARRVAIVDKDGNVVGYTSGREVLKGLAAVQELEHAVDDGVRPKEVVCQLCGRLFQARSRGHVPKICGCAVRATCAGFGDTRCAKVPGPIAFTPSKIKGRDGAAWRCQRCVAQLRLLQPAERERLQSNLLKMQSKEAQKKREKTVRGRLVDPKVTRNRFNKLRLERRRRAREEKEKDPNFAIEQAARKATRAAKIAESVKKVWASLSHKERRDRSKKTITFRRTQREHPLSETSAAKKESSSR